MFTTVSSEKPEACLQKEIDIKNENRCLFTNTYN